jgi:hypothetical protein
MSQVTGLEFYEFFRTGHRSPEAYTNTSNKSQNRQKIAQKIQFFASAPPACEAVPQHLHEVPVLSFSNPSGIFGLSGRSAIAATMSETRKLQCLCEKMMSEPVLESQVKASYFEPFYNYPVIAGKANVNI